MTTYRVLLVDDDAFFLQVYGDFLRSRGFEVECASSGEAALEAFTPGRFQLVVVDLVMRGITGIELIERIRSTGPAQDIIVVTGSDDVRTAVRAMRLGVYDYLVKPIEREELILVIDRLQERATLYDEHARLLHENIMYAEVQQIFQLAMRVMRTLDLETVCERLLETLSQICRAQGAILWLSSDEAPDMSMHGYRGLVDPASVALAWDPVNTSVGKHLVRGLPVLVERDLGEVRRAQEPAESLLVPLARDGRLAGVVHLLGKLSGGFDAKDAAFTKIVGDVATTAVVHARRFRKIERVGLRDPSTAAYNMTFFVDYLGRELHKARRYNRSFSLVQMSLDNLSTLEQGLTPGVFRETKRRLVLAVTSVLRDIDVLARVTDEEMYLLLPETDFLGGLTFSRTARDAIRDNPFLADIDRQLPINVSFGPAAFSRDGDDVDQLFAACRRRVDEARRSLFRRLHLDDVDFWSTVDLLIGPDSAYQADDVVLSAGLSVMEDERGVSRHHVFPEGFVDALRCEALGEAGRQGRSAGWLFLGGAWSGSGPQLTDAFDGLAGGQLKTYVLGRSYPERLRDVPGVTLVRVDGDVFGRHEVVLLLAEHTSYAMLAKRRADGRAYGFHTADWTLVEGLINKLQDTYHLQKSTA
ncbi:MAG: response regulator [Myxococcota bacterium]